MRISLTGGALKKDVFVVFLNGVQMVVQEQCILGLSLTGDTFEKKVFLAFLNNV